MKKNGSCSNFDTFQVFHLTNDNTGVLHICCFSHRFNRKLRWPWSANHNHKMKTQLQKVKHNEKEKPQVQRENANAKRKNATAK